MTLGTNLLLAVLWAALIGPFTPWNVALGFLIGFVVLRLCRPRGNRPPYARRSLAVLSLAGFTVYELLLANLRVARYTVSHLGTLRPAVLAVPLQPDLSDGEITLLSMLVTLTPGTLTLDVARDRKKMFVHFMHVDDAEQAIRAITEGFERRILEVTR